MSRIGILRHSATMRARMRARAAHQAKMERWATEWAAISPAMLALKTEFDREFQDALALSDRVLTGVWRPAPYPLPGGVA